MSIIIKLIETERLVVAITMNWVEREMEIDSNGYTVSFWCDENVLKFDSRDGCTTKCWLLSHV